MAAASSQNTAVQPRHAVDRDWNAIPTPAERRSVRARHATDRGPDAAAEPGHAPVNGIALLDRFLRDRKALWQAFDRALELRDSPLTVPEFRAQFHYRAAEIVEILKGTA